MTHPLVLSTWSFGQRANAAAWPVLASGKSALDAVEAACRDAEEDLTNHTVGIGGYPDRDGRVSLDASIMLSPARCGSVATIRRFAHPVSIARRVMEQTSHILLAGQGADDFALAQGFEPVELLTDDAKAAWLSWREKHPLPVRNIEEQSPGNEFHDTIGVLAMDDRGKLAGACSTSGFPFKVPGRVGDSPIIGHGLYVDPDVGASVATGHGELVMGVCGTFLAVELMRRGASPLDAAVEVLQRIADTYDLAEHDQVGIITMTRSGEWDRASLRPGFRVAVRTADRDEMVDPGHVLIG